MNFCKYSNILGEPKKGIHSYRIFNLALVDILLTIICGFFIHKYFLYKYISIYLTIFILFILGIIIHKIFCVKTTINSIIFK